VRPIVCRLTPAGPQKTKARVWWLVHKDAKEGVDYTLDRLLPIWQRTSEQVRPRVHSFM
jgi:Rieske 2Fe-2S family protein